MYQGRPAFEGVYSVRMPCPPNVAVCIKVDARFSGPLAPPSRPVPFINSTLGAPYIGRAPLIAPGADIHPGKFNPIKFSAWEVGGRMSLTPAARGDLEYLYRLGQADAAAWARSVGVPGA